jgi:hypothetical protein
MPSVPSREELKRRLGPADLLQIRLLLRVPPEQRIETMLRMKKAVLNMWHARLEKSHPELSDLELWQLIFRRLKRNG